MIASLEIGEEEHGSMETAERPTVSQPSGRKSAEPARTAARFPRLVNTRGILVTGSHRSGTTWVGRCWPPRRRSITSTSPSSPAGRSPIPSPFRSLVPFIAEHNAARWESDVLRTLRFHYSWRYTYDEAPGLKQAWKASNRWFRWNTAAFAAIARW